MFVSIFYKCFTLVVLLGFIELCACFAAEHEHSSLTPAVDEPASRRSKRRQYQPENGQGAHGSEASADLFGIAKREASTQQGQDLASIRRRFSLGEDLQSIAQENYQRELSRGGPEVTEAEAEEEGEVARPAAADEKTASLLDDEDELAGGISSGDEQKSANLFDEDEPATAVKKSINLPDDEEVARTSAAEQKSANLFDDNEPVKLRMNPTAASRKIKPEALDDEVPHLNYYYPSIGNMIGPMAAPYHRHRRRGDTGVTKREASLEDDLDAKKEETPFPIKRVMQKPIMIDADSLMIDEPASMDWQDELERQRNAFSRRRRRTQEVGSDESAIDSDEEGAANFIHYQIENLKAKVKREFEQSRKLNKRSKLDEKHERRLGNEKRDTKDVRASSSKVRRMLIPSASPSRGMKRRRQAVVMDLSQFEELDRNDALRSNVLRELENVKNFNKARAKKQAPQRNSLSRVTKRDTGTFHAWKAEKNVRLLSDEGLTSRRAKREPSSFEHYEWKVNENVPFTPVDKVKRKRNVDSLANDRSDLKNDELAPAAGYSLENMIKKRRRREVGEYSAGNNLKENKPLLHLGEKSFETKVKREYSNSKTDDFSKDIIQKNEADIAKMQQDLDNLFKTINLSKSKNIIPSSTSQNVWKKFPNNKMAEDSETSRDNAGDNYMEINENAQEYALDNNGEKAHATHHAEESLEGSSEHAIGDALKESHLSSKGSLSASKAKFQSSSEESAEEEDVDDLERQAEDIVNRRQMGSRQSDHRARNSMYSPDIASPRRRLLSMSEASVTENDHASLVAESKRNLDAGFYSEMMSNVQDELQGDKVLSAGDKNVQQSQPLKESDISHADGGIKSEGGGREMSLSNFMKNGETEASASGSERQWLEKQSGLDISYGTDDSMSSPQLGAKGKRETNSHDKEQKVMESSKRAAHDIQDTISDEKLLDSRTADKFKAVDRELQEHNQRAIELRDMDIKVGPQVAEVAKLIEQSRQKEINKERNQASCDNTLASLTRTDNDHIVLKKAETDATSATLNEERNKRSLHHHSGNHSLLKEQANNFPVDGYPHLTGDLDIDLKRYFYGDDKDLHRTMYHGKDKVNYKPVVDWQAGDRERFAQLQAHRKMNGGGFEDYQITPTLTSSDTSNVISLQESNNHKFIGGKTKLGENRDLRSNAESLDPLSKIIRPEKSHGLTLNNPRNNLGQRRKLFELLKLSKSKLNPEPAMHEAEAPSGSGGTWLELFFKNKAIAEERKRKANAMESNSAVTGADEIHNQLKKNVAPESHLHGRRPDGYGDMRHQCNDYVIKKRDLSSGGSGDDRPIGRVYTGRQFRDNNFHRRRVPPYGLPSADLFNKWDMLGDVHGFSKSLFNNLQSSPDEEIVAGFDNEGKYISPIALDRVKRMRHRRRRRRGAPEERRRRRRGRRRTYLFPGADPVDEFFSSRPARAVDGEEEEDEGEAAPRAVRLRERRAVARRDEKGWPVTRSGGCTRAQHLAAMAIVLIHYAS